MIEENLYNLMSLSNVKHGLDDETMDFVINLEVLNGCDHACPGCYVRRKNAITHVDLNTAYTLASDMIKNGFRFREVIISPTDIFSATNSLDILKNKDFQNLMKLDKKTRITSTAMYENINWDNVNDIFTILDDESLYRKDMIMEFLVPMNVEKILNRDEKYYSDFKQVIEFLNKKTPKIVDWSFVVNVHYDEKMINNYNEITKIAKEEFNTIIEFLPSFFRTGNDAIIEEHLDTWKSFLRSIITTENYNNIMLTIADKNHNASNTVVVNYKKNELFISPFVYEQIVFDYPELKVEHHTFHDTIEKVQRLIEQQYTYSELTTECSSCEFLTTCIGRNVLSLMEAKGIKDCIYPKEILQLYNN